MVTGFDTAFIYAEDRTIILHIKQPLNSKANGIACWALAHDLLCILFTLISCRCRAGQRVEENAADDYVMHLYHDCPPRMHICCKDQTQGWGDARTSIPRQYFRNKAETRRDRCKNWPNRLPRPRPIARGQADARRVQTGRRGRAKAKQAALITSQQMSLSIYKFGPLSISLLLTKIKLRK